MIKNATKNKIICTNIEIADSLGKQTKGLMFRESFDPESGFFMIFDSERKHGIWMFGMRFPIDIIFIDSGKRIVDIKHSVRPMNKNPRTWKVYKPKKPCTYVLEINSNVIEKTGTEIGDILEFQMP